MSSLSLADAKTAVSSYDSAYRALVQDLVDAKVAWRTADALLDTLIASGASSADIQAQNVVISNLEMTIATTQASLKSLKHTYDEAQDVINQSLSIPDPDTIVTNPFVGVTGPTGPKGDTGGATGPAGPRGYSLDATSSASVGSLAVATSLYAPQATFSSASITALSASNVSIGSLSASSLSVPSLTVSDLYASSLSAGLATATTVSTDNITITGVCTAQGLVSASSVNVSGLCTAAGGFVGSLLTSAQPGITGLGTLSSLTVSGAIGAGSVSVSGLTTSSQGFVGTLLTGSQTGISSVGVLSSLTVSGNVTLSGALSQTGTSSAAFVSTSSLGTSSIALFTNSGSTGYELGVRSSGTFYVSHLKASGVSVNKDRLVIDSSGYCGIATSSPNANLDVGGCTSTMLGSLSNVAAFLGSSTCGVVVGAGTSGTNPFIAASKSSAGTSLSLDFYTGDTSRLSISTSGSITIPGTLSVGGTDFASAIGGLGYSQSWQTVTSSRGVSTGVGSSHYYQNSTSRPIAVNVCLSVSGTAGTNIYNFNMGTSTSAMTAYSTLATQIAATTVTVDYCNFSLIVPPSYYYQVARSSGSSTTTIQLWAELM